MFVNFTLEIKNDKKKVVDYLFQVVGISLSPLPYFLLLGLGFRHKYVEREIKQIKCII